jgi:hypothetical protein
MRHLGHQELINALTRRQALRHATVGGAAVVAGRGAATPKLAAQGDVAPTSVKTSNYTASPGDYVPVDASQGSITITLPTAPSDQSQVAVSTVAIAAPNAVTVACGGSDVVNVAGGPTSLSLQSLNQGVLAQYDAGTSIWYVQAVELTLGVAMGAAQLGSDGKVGGLGGSPLGSQILTAPAHHDLDSNGNMVIGSSWASIASAAKQNVALGYQALSSLTSGLQNYAIGTYSQLSNQVAVENISIGYKTLHLNTSGSHNVAIGDEAMGDANAGSCCVGVGKISLKVNQGDFNTAIGEAALTANSTGTENTSVGGLSLVANTIGSRNSAFGYEAGMAIVDGSSNTVIGAFAGNTDGTTRTAASVRNTTLLGFQAQATTNNVIVLGAATVRSNLIFGGVGAAAAFGGGLGVFALAEAATIPSGNPAGGGVLYVSGGALVYRGPNGTVTTIANA